MASMIKIHVKKSASEQVQRHYDYGLMSLIADDVPASPGQTVSHRPFPASVGTLEFELATE